MKSFVLLLALSCAFGFARPCVSADASRVGNVAKSSAETALSLLLSCVVIQAFEGQNRSSFDGLVDSCRDRLSQKGIWVGIALYRGAGSLIRVADSGLKDLAAEEAKLFYSLTHLAWTLTIVELVFTSADGIKILRDSSRSKDQKWAALAELIYTRSAKLGVRGAIVGTTTLISILRNAGMVFRLGTGVVGFAASYYTGKAIDQFHQWGKDRLYEAERGLSERYLAGWIADQRRIGDAEWQHFDLIVKRRNYERIAAFRKQAEAFVKRREASREDVKKSMEAVLKSLQDETMFLDKISPMVQETILVEKIKARQKDIELKNEVMMALGNFSMQESA